jgi:[acyl-carrier-protein] S-malonyltransferase
VVACAEQSFGALQAAVAERGGRGIRLTVSGAFHSPFMDAASGRIARYLESVEFAEGRIPLYSNVTARPYGSTGNPAQLLARQVNSPVRGQKTAENMIADGFDTFVEVGPGKTLTGLIKKINAEAAVYNASGMSDISDIAKVIA